MMGYRLWAALLGALLGPAPIAAEPVEAEPTEIEEPSPGRAVGHTVRGLDFHVWDEDPREAASWAYELSEAGGRSATGLGWWSLALETAARPALLSEALEAQLVASDEGRETAGAITPLGCVLCLLPSLDRTALITSWATSPSEPKRRALAGALSAPFEAVGRRSAIEHLEADSSSEVRRLARRARR